MSVTALTNMANRDVFQCVLEDYTTHVTYLNLDFANVTTTDVTGETVYAYGGQGHTKRIPFTGERGGTIKIETQIQPFKLYSMMSGSAITTTANFIKRQTATTTAETPTITLASAPAAGTVVNVFLASDDCGTVVPSTVAGTTVTLTTPAANAYVVYYIETLSSVQKISVTSTTFPGAFKIYMKTLDKTENLTTATFMITAYKCVPQANFTVAASSSGDPGSLTITFDMLSDPDGNLIDMAIA